MKITLIIDDTTHVIEDIHGIMLFKCNGSHEFNRLLDIILSSRQRISYTTITTSRKFNVHCEALEKGLNYINNSPFRK